MLNVGYSYANKHTKDVDANRGDRILWLLMCIIFTVDNTLKDQVAR